MPRNIVPTSRFSRGKDVQRLHFLRSGRRHRTPNIRPPDADSDWSASRLSALLLVHKHHLRT